MIDERKGRRLDVAGKKTYNPINPADYQKVNGGKQFVNLHSGEIISRRQFYNAKRGESVESYTKKRKAEAQAAHARGEAPLPKPRAPKGSKKALKEAERAHARKTPGAVKKNVGNPDYKFLTVTDKQSSRIVNKRTTENRLDVIAFKQKHGAITKVQAEALQTEVRQEHYYRNKMMEINERLKWNAMKPGGKPFTSAQRKAMNKEYARAHKKYEQARKKLEKYKIIPPEGSDFNAGHYH